MSPHFCFPSLGAAPVASWVGAATPVEVPPNIPVLPKVLDVEVGPTSIEGGRYVATNGV